MRRGPWDTKASLAYRHLADGGGEFSAAPFALGLQGNLMAVETSGGHPAMDYAEHLRTYAGFTRAVIIVTGLIALLLIGMAVFLVP
jgi:hypothetical protein